ncbi:MAG: sulfotransferase [Deltaproteobacteria bacterium]|nr:sulfotransferase [Deltaproteobacteria bacterium]
MKLLRWLQNQIGNAQLLRWLDKKMCVFDCRSTPDPIFIVGSPRVGSTVFFQSVIAKYQMAYLSNLHSLFFSQPCLADILVRAIKFCGFSHRHTMKSDFGYTSGVLGPSEAGATFRYWFGDADFSLNDHITNCQQVISAVATLSKSAAGPLISKNLFNSMRLKEVLKCFPNAFLVWVQRDHSSTVKSILKMRESVNGSDKEWTSVSIPNQQEILKYLPEEQALQQILAIETYIKQYFEQHREGRTFMVSYDSFRLEPEKIIDRFIKKYSEISGYEVSIRDGFCSSVFDQVNHS